MDLKGSKTEKNLETAFAGESMARNKYTYFSSVITSYSIHYTKLYDRSP